MTRQERRKRRRQRRRMQVALLASLLFTLVLIIILGMDPAGNLRKLFFTQLGKLLVQGFNLLLEGVQFFFGFHGVYATSSFM